MGKRRGFDIPDQKLPWVFCEIQYGRSNVLACAPRREMQGRVTVHWDEANKHSLGELFLSCLGLECQEAFSIMTVRVTRARRMPKLSSTAFMPISESRTPLLLSVNVTLPSTGSCRAVYDDDGLSLKNGYKSRNIVKSH